MFELEYLLPQLLFALPAVVTLTVGAVLLWNRRGRLLPRVRALGSAGLAVLLAGAVTNLLYQLLLPEILRGGRWMEMRVAIAGMNLLFMVLQVLGLALVIAALLATAPPATPWSRPAPETGPWDQPPPVTPLSQQPAEPGPWDQPAPPR
ncbi:hypothetical protein AB0J72_35845 [Dactylosporangium sp. NPDC049742]|uniref:hypothetical protein n=1 Tax=Dactylosporangium sp. NPDC049742 TaxID=3154737 RepID=UPI00341F4F8F